MNASTSAEWRPSVSIIISTRNRRASLERVLAAIAKQTYGPIETLLIDNGSEDGTVAMVERQWAEVRVIGSMSNRGFARSINAGVEAAAGELVLFLPDDVVAEPTYVEELVSALRATGAVAAGGLLLESPDTTRINYAGATLSRILRLRFERGRVPSDEEPHAVSFVPGGNCLIRRDAFLGLGGFDEDYSSFFEDVDLCARARAARARLVFVPRARAFHLTHPTETTPTRAFYDRRNIAIFYFKNADPAVLAGFLCYHVALALPKDLWWAAFRIRDRKIVASVIRGHTWWFRNLRFLLKKRRAARGRKALM